MLFASTRLTLVRELGIERFRETLFVTEASELTPEGWARHEKHTAQEAPLTEEEAGQAGLREAEAQESGGTMARKGHVGNRADALKKEEGLEAALGELMKEENKGLLIQLVSKADITRGPELSSGTAKLTTYLRRNSTSQTKPSASRPPPLPSRPPPSQQHSPRLTPG